MFLFSLNVQQTVQNYYSTITIQFPVVEERNQKILERLEPKNVAILSFKKWSIGYQNSFLSID